MRKGCNKKDIKTNMKTKISLYKTQIDNTLLPLESIFLFLCLFLYILLILFSSTGGYLKPYIIFQKFSRYLLTIIPKFVILMSKVDYVKLYIRR